MHRLTPSWSGTAIADSAPGQVAVPGHPRTFAIGENDFLLDGEPFRIVSGAMHYFRIHPAQWAERIAAARDFGLNTIDTYVAWNAHSRSPEEFRTDGWCDLGRYLDLVADAGLYAIVRPGPYICAEWSNGGLPAWLTARPDIALRSMDPRYLDAVRAYFDQVLPLIAARQVTQGGNVILVQVENEYGAFGADGTYIRTLADMTRASGIDVPLFTCDQANEEMLTRGGVPEIHKTATFGSRSAERLQTLRRVQPTGPLMCSEYWDGWFDAWGGHHRTTDAAESAADLATLLEAGASVNFYMFCGGTNLGAMAGANDKGTYAATTTSYDYDAPLAEDGAPGPKFAAYRAVLARLTGLPASGMEARSAAPQFSTTLRLGPRWDEADWGEERAWDYLPTLDEVDPGAVVIRYETALAAGQDVVAFEEVRDRAQCFVNGRAVGVLLRSHHERAIAVGPDAGARLTLLVEDLGRVNYGPRLGEAKGLIGPARTSAGPLQGWVTATATTEQLWDMGKGAGGRELGGVELVAGPVFLRADFAGQPGTDLFLDLNGWGHGLVWLNGCCLGRYWSMGPTQTMYVPGPLVQERGNHLLVLEMDAMVRPTVQFVAGPQLGHTEE